MITVDKVKSALVDKNDLDWNNLSADPKVVPVVLSIIKDNYKRNKIPSSLIESMSSYVHDGIRLEDVMLLMRIK
jgi:hypothetical protein